MSDALIGRLGSIVGTVNVLTDTERMQPYVIDWTRRFGGPAECVVRPGSVDEVRAVLLVCGEAGVAVVPQGGNTGLVGGSVPSTEGQPPVVMSLRRLDWIGDVDPVAGQLTCGAGATLAAVRQAAAVAGWEYGVDLAARDSATIGGTVATNAGGIRVLAHGMTRAQLVGIEAVLPDGSVISHLAGLLKDNTGLDLAALLCGSEGTLAVITAVRVRLRQPMGATTVALIGCDTYSDAQRVIREAVAPGYTLVGAEILDATCMRLVCGVTGLPYPLVNKHPYVLLLDVADGGTGDGFAGLEERDVVVGLDAHERERLWRYRESQADALATLGVLHKFDVSVPLMSLAAFGEEMDAFLSVHPEVTGFGIMGHIGDGNLHVEVAGPDADDMAFDREVLACVARYGGSVSAEHGIGRAKVEFLELTRSPAEIAAMRAVKRAWDPHGILNPGVLFP